MAASVHFRLLDLPRELRDIIYGYALTEEAGLTVLPLSPSCLRPADNLHGPDPNPLKFVCRQLYAETKGLGLRYNKLTFPGSFSPAVFDKFTQKYCSPANFGRVGSVAILQTSYSKLKEELQVADIISKEYPALSVEVRVNWIYNRLNLESWCQDGMFAQYVTRGTFPELASAYQIARVGLVTAHFGYDSGDSCWVDSTDVRVFLDEFDEERLRFRAINSDIEDIDGWLAQFKKWFEEGF